jgi:hypothetical protein
LFLKRGILRACGADPPYYILHNVQLLTFLQNMCKSNPSWPS